LTISFSGLPTASSVSPQAEASVTVPPSQQNTTKLDDHVESAADHAASNAEALHSPPGFETISAVVDKATELAGPVQSAFDHAELLTGTLECLGEAVGYINGVIELVKDFADVSVFLLRCLETQAAVTLDPPYFEGRRRRTDKSL
jgi:hypothetical protein